MLVYRPGATWLSAIGTNGCGLVGSHLGCVQNKAMAWTGLGTGAYARNDLSNGGDHTKGLRGNDSATAAFTGDGMSPVAVRCAWD